MKKMTSKILRISILTFSWTNVLAQKFDTWSAGGTFGYKGFNDKFELKNVPAGSTVYFIENLAINNIYTMEKGAGF